jgi:general secretion pathway protein K
VLWALVLIAGLSALFVAILGMQLRSNAAIVRGTQAQAMADGALRVIAWRLANDLPAAAGQSDRVPRDGEWFACTMFDGTLARVAVQDQDGLVDLNSAPLPLLDTLFGARLSDTEARRAMQAVESNRALLAEAPAADPEGQSADRLDLGAPGIFSSPDELTGFIGGEASAAALLPLMTVYSRSDSIDPKVAPPALIAALGGRPGNETAGLPPEIVRASRGRFFQITADVGSPRLGRSVRRAAVQILRQADKPFAVWEWTTIDAGEGGAPTALPPAQSCAGEQ